MVPVKGSGYRGFVFGFPERRMIGEQFCVGLLGMCSFRHDLYNRCDDGREMKEVVKMAEVVTLRTMVYLLDIFADTFMHAVLFRSDHGSVGNVEEHR